MEDRFNAPHISAIEVEVLGHSLFVSQDPNSKHLGTTVWDSSLVFAKFLERNSRKGEFSRARVSGKRAIELGAGCGLAGLGMALLGCNVVATDQVPVLPLLLRNVQRNLAGANYAAADQAHIGPIGRMEVAELDWGNEAHVAAVAPPFDYVIGTDVVYVEHLLEPLLATILAVSGPKTTVLLGYEFRASGVRERLHELFSQHFHVKKVPHAKMDPKYQHPNIDLLILKRIGMPTSGSRVTEGEEVTDCASTEDCGAGDGERTSGEAACSKEQVTCESTVEGLPPEICQGRVDVTALREEPLSLSSDTKDFKSSSCNTDGAAALPGETFRVRSPEWQMRRLGASAARLLSGISIPSLQI